MPLGILGTNEILIILILTIIAVALAMILGKNARKAIGILFLIVGLICCILGIATLTEASSQENSLEETIKNTFNQRFRSDIDNRKSIGTFFLAAGVLLFTTGLVMVTFRYDREKRTEIKPDSGRTIYPSYDQTYQNIKNESINDRILRQLQNLGRLKDQGILTEAEFQEQKKRILG